MNTSGAKRNKPVKTILHGAMALGIVMLTPAAPAAAATPHRPLFAAIGGTASPPIGWVRFCVEYAPQCKTTASKPQDVALTARAWAYLMHINRWVNANIRPITDQKHWGVVERWNYPDDGYGDCEDYVLEKRRMLMAAGWPRSALLITVVHDENDEGHAVLTVATDKGDFVLDNQRDDVLLWSETGYRFLKRQSQSDPNVWVSLGAPSEAPATSAARLDATN